MTAEPTPTALEDRAAPVGAGCAALPLPPKPSGRDARRAALAACLGVSLFLLLYLPALGTFFSSDDWIWLHYPAKLSPLEFWRFFSPEVIWFYRPLQQLQFSVLYHLFGMDAFAYNVSALLLHVLGCAAAFLFARELTGRPWVAAAAATLFAAQWSYADVLLWKSNFSALHWGVATLALCFAFTRFLRTGAGGWRWAAYLLYPVSLMGKEQAINTPLLLALIWAYCELRPADFRRERLAATLKRGAALVGPVAAMALLYLAAHRLWVRNVYFETPQGYDLAAPLAVVKNALFVYNHTLLSFYPDPLVLPHLPELRAAVLWLARSFLLLPLLLAIVAARLRDRLLLFSLAWIVLAFLPCVALETFHLSRFYYLSALGGAFFWIAAVERSWRALRRSSGAGARVGRIALAVFVAWGLTATAAVTNHIMRAAGQQSAVARDVYDFLRERRADVPKGSLLVFRGGAEWFFRGGLGTAEMVKVALDDPSAEGMVERQRLHPARRERYRRIPTVVVVDLGRRPFQLRRGIVR